MSKDETDRDCSIRQNIIVDRPHCYVKAFVTDVLFFTAAKTEGLFLNKFLGLIGQYGFENAFIDMWGRILLQIYENFSVRMQ